MAKYLDSAGLSHFMTTVKTALNGMLRYMGSVATEADLPSSGQSVGDMYNIEAASSYGQAGTNVVWNGSLWDVFGSFSITSITNAEIDTIVAS